jgi:filamentous hemagglutinin family protein
LCADISYAFPISGRFILGDSVWGAAHPQNGEALFPSSYLAQGGRMKIFLAKMKNWLGCALALGCCFSGAAVGDSAVSGSSLLSATVTLGNLNYTYSGTQKSTTCDTVPAGLATTLSYSDLGQGVGLINAGSYGVSCTVTEAGYSGSASGTLVISPFNLTLNASNVSKVYDGTLLQSPSIAAGALPNNGTVALGTANFSTLDTTLTIEATPGTVINWTDFPIGAGATVNIVQQSADSAVLIRVTGGNPLQIVGNLKSNGRIFIVDPAGIYFYAGSKVDVANLVTSTIDLSDQNFASNPLPSGSGTGGIVNTGVLINGIDLSSNGSWTAANLTANTLSGLTISSGIAGDALISTSFAGAGALSLSGVSISLVGSSSVASNYSLTVGNLAGGTITLASQATLIDALRIGSLASAANLGSLIGLVGSISVGQPTITAVALNSVTGIDPSMTFGQLQSNGKVFLVNSSLTLFDATAIADANGLVAPTATVSNLGWNLLGNCTDAPLDVASTFGDASKVSTVWKWNPASNTWAFYSPSLTVQELTDYTTSKGYEVLATIGSGEGFWVNAKTPFAFALPAGKLLSAADFQTKLVPGWNMISIGENKLPGQFNSVISQAPPSVGGATSPSLNAVWAWDNAQSNWYFYAPSLEAQGGTALTDYINSKGYLDFTAANKMLAPGTGFWVKKQ